MAFFLSFFFLTYVVDFLVGSSIHFHSCTLILFQPAKRSADKGLTETGDMIYDPARAEASGHGHYPTAPSTIARDMGPNHPHSDYNTMTSNNPSLNQQPMREAPGDIGQRA